MEAEKNRSGKPNRAVPGEFISSRFTPQEIRWYVNSGRIVRMSGGSLWLILDDSLLERPSCVRTGKMRN